MRPSTYPGRRLPRLLSSGTRNSSNCLRRRLVLPAAQRFPAAVLHGRSRGSSKVEVDGLGPTVRPRNIKIFQLLSPRSMRPPGREQQGERERERGFHDTRRYRVCSIQPSFILHAVPFHSLSFVGRVDHWLLFFFFFMLPSDAPAIRA